jgi:hypothetical protein
MIDAVGKVVFQTSIDLNNETKLVNIPVTNLATGLYTIMVSDRQNEMKAIRFQKTQQ